MKIIVIGNGKIGQSIIRNVSEEGHSITIIDCDSRVVSQMIDTYDVMASLVMALVWKYKKKLAFKMLI